MVIFVVLPGAAVDKCFCSLESLSPNSPYSGIISNIIQCLVEWKEIPIRMALTLQALESPLVGVGQHGSVKEDVQGKCRSLFADSRELLGSKNQGC